MQTMEWDGQWDISWHALEEKTFRCRGTCRFSTTDGACLEIPSGNLSISRALSATGSSPHGLSGAHYNYLFGRADDGTYLVLCDALSIKSNFSLSSKSSEMFTAPVVLAAHNRFEPETPVTSVRFEVQRLNDWMRLSRFELMGDGTYHDNKGAAVKLFESPIMHAQILLDFDNSNFSPDKTTAKPHCQVNINYSSSMPLEEIWRGPIWRIRSLFAFCFGFYPAIFRAQIQYLHDEQWVNVYRSSANTIKQPRLLNYPPLAFSSLGSYGLAALADNWFQLSGDKHHAANMLTSLLGAWNMPIDLKLLSATTMLEALMRADRADIYDKETFAQLIKPMINAADEQIKDRVNGLLGLLQKPSYSQLLNEAYEESLPWSSRLIPNWNRFKKEQQALRTNGAHGKNGAADPHLQINHYNAQIVIAYIILMKRLGLPKEVIDQFENSNFLNAARWRISQYYTSSR